MTQGESIPAQRSSISIDKGEVESQRVAALIKFQENNIKLIERSINLIDKHLERMNSITENHVKNLDSIKTTFNESIDQICN